MPRVSICIPAYEEASLLVRTIESVFEQTFGDFEVIVTDDSASPAIEVALNPWLSDARLRYVRNVERLGSPENWNKAVALAEGALIKVLHHDDWFSGDDSLQQYVALMDNEPNASLGFSGAFARDSSERLLFRHAPSEEQIAALRQDPRCLFFANFIGAPSATIFRRMAGFRFDINLKWLVDAEAYIRILRNGGTFAYSPKPLVNITASASHQVTRLVQADPVLQFVENAYACRLLGFKGTERLGLPAHFVNLARQLDKSQLEAVAADPRVVDPSFEVRMPLKLRKLRLAAEPLAVAVSGILAALKRPAVTSRESYSQCGEDVIMDFLLMWLGIGDVRYLDIGASHPTRFSNTYFFYRKGYNGVLIEPDPEMYKLLATERPRDRLLNVAIGVDGNPVGKLFMMTSRTLNTLVASQATDYQSYGRESVEGVMEVAQRDINDVLSTEFDRTPNLVSLDIEGLDLEVLRSWNFSDFRPEVFCIETLTFTQNRTERKITEIAELMESRGYFVYADTHINTIFVSTHAWNARSA